MKKQISDLTPRQFSRGTPKAVQYDARKRRRSVGCVMSFENPRAGPATARTNNSCVETRHYQSRVERWVQYQILEPHALDPVQHTVCELQCQAREILHREKTNQMSCFQAAQLMLSQSVHANGHEVDTNTRDKGPPDRYAGCVQRQVTGTKARCPDRPTL